MTDQTTTVVLVHGAFAESASWNGVIELLQGASIDAVAVANPLRSLSGDAAYLRDVLDGIGKPTVLVGHSYAGMVITEAAASSRWPVALVYVNAFAPDYEESALGLSTKFPGSTLGETLVASPVSTGGNEFVIRQDRYHQQFVADVTPERAAVMAATQRPVTEAALTETLAASMPAWKRLPSWFVFSDRDLNIPVALHRYQAERSQSRRTREVEGGSHALSVSQPGPVTESILDAVDATRYSEAFAS